ncbi:unnamed protein product [Heligmosomoides polygyrus]|uniref:PLAT domain-containing protein n=1 Tax=Heligmosomoides polygyrus TaxID=6339 RepID=A0A183GEX3_HELPZ|nr:unnamed protein product [Heligmosomoides polygyrus]
MWACSEERRTGFKPGFTDRLAKSLDKQLLERESRAILPITGEGEDAATSQPTTFPQKKVMLSVWYANGSEPVGSELSTVLFTRISHLQMPGDEFLRIRVEHIGKKV